MNQIQSFGTFVTYQFVLVTSILRAFHNYIPYIQPHIPIISTIIHDAICNGNVQSLNLEGCVGITDVIMLSNVQTSDLIWCTGITDVSVLANDYLYMWNFQYFIICDPK